MSAYGTTRPRLESAKWAKAEVDQVAVVDTHTYNDEAGTANPLLPSRLILEHE
jgi:hypothetical protein